MGVDAERDARVDTTAEPVVVSTPAFSAPPYRSDWRLLRSVEDLRLGKKRSAFIKAYRHAYVGRPNDGAVVEQVRVKEDIPLYIFILFHQTLVAIIHRTYIDVHIH